MDEGPPVANLHLHTTALDGRLTIDALPDAAHVGGVDMVTVTDYDRYHPEPDTLVVKRDGVTVVRDIELRVNTSDRRIDLLGYGLREQSVLIETVERLQRNRVERAREVAATVEKETGVRPKIDIHDDVGRPHVTCVIDASEALYDYQGAFDELIGADGPCYTMRELPMFDDGAAALRDTCDVVGLVHPFRYRDSVGALELCADLDAAEHYYSYGFDVEADLTEKAVGHYGLLVTGGSDAHNEMLGRIRPSETDFTRPVVAVDGL